MKVWFNKNKTLILVFAILCVVQNSSARSSSLLTPTTFHKNINKRIIDSHKQSKEDLNINAENNVAISTPRGGKITLPGSPGFTTSNMLGALFFMIFDSALRKIFTEKQIEFPSMMAGLVILFALLVGMETLSTGLGDKVFQLLLPGTNLLSKWLPVFFIPGLIMAPLAPKLGSALEVCKYCSLHNSIYCVGNKQLLTHYTILLSFFLVCSHSNSMFF